MNDQESKLVLFDIFGSKYLRPLCFLAVAIILGPRMLNAFVQRIQILGGKETQLSISVFLKFVFNKGIPILAAVLFFLYAKRADHLRRKSIESMQGRIQELEEYINPERKTSGLTTIGTTEEADK